MNTFITLATRLISLAAFLPARTILALIQATVLINLGSPITLAASFIKIGVITDHTGSAVENSTPQLIPADLDPLVEIIKNIGGSIGVFPVRAKAQGGLIRLTIDPPTVKPVMPNLKNVSVFSRRELLKTYRAALDQWTAGESLRLKNAEDAIKTFQAQIKGVLVTMRNEPRSDVHGALLRLDRYLLEPVPGHKVEALALIGSDLIDTAGKNRYVLGSTPRVAWVNRATNLPQIFRSYELFENVQPAVSWLASQTGGREGDY